MFDSVAQVEERLRKAQQKGIKVVTYDSDSVTDARSFFVNQATPEGIGYGLMDEAARLCGAEGEFAIITASLTAANMNEWQKRIEARRASTYPKMKMVALRPCDAIGRPLELELLQHLLKALAILGAVDRVRRRA